MWMLLIFLFGIFVFTSTTTVYLKILSSPRVRNWDHPYASCPYSTPLGQGAEAHSRFKKTNAADESKHSACQLEIPAEMAWVKHISMSTATTHAVNHQSLTKSQCQNKTYQDLLQCTPKGRKRWHPQPLLSNYQTHPSSAAQVTGSGSKR